VNVAGTYLSGGDVAALTSKLRDVGMSEYADRIEDAYQEGIRLFHISTTKLTAAVAVAGDVRAVHR
jgi:hypothetical protein